MQLELLEDLILTALEDLKAFDIKVLPVSERTPVADRLIIASGRSERHVQAIAEHVATTAKHQNLQPLGIEGRGDSDWVLVDLGDIIVHVMLPRTRDFYHLEGLWEASPETTITEPPKKAIS